MSQILLGECLDVLKTLPDNSVDSVITDPPYGLGTREPTIEDILRYLQGVSALAPLKKGPRHCANSILRASVIPETDHFKPEVIQNLVTFKVRVHQPSIMPAGVVEFDNQVPFREEEIDSVGPVFKLDDFLMDESDSDPIQLLHDSQFSLRESKAFSGCVKTCGCFTPISSSLFRMVVRLVDGTLGQSERSSSIMALGATEVIAVLTLDMARHTGEICLADPTDQLDARLFLSTPKNVGATTRASGLLTLIQHLLRGQVKGVADRAATFDVSLPAALVDRFHTLHIPQKDFMAKDWEIPSVSVWKECYRVLKPGGHLLSFGGTRTYDLISMGLRAAGFECRDTIATQLGVQVLQWVQGQGFPRGQVLKPAWEPILVFRKHLEGSISDNVDLHGTGRYNIDETRVGTRWPSNMIFTHLESCQKVGSKRVKAPVINRFDDGMKPFGGGAGHAYTSKQQGDAEGLEEIPVYECVEGCSVKALEEQNKDAPKFFCQFKYIKKANKKERGEDNNHPCVKPLDLMKWLVQLVVPADGVVLDPYCGSGTTCLAAQQVGRSYIGIEKDPKFHSIAIKRLTV